MTPNRRLVTASLVALATGATLAATCIRAEAQGTPPAEPKRYRYEQKIMADPPPAAVTLKKRIAVARFDDDTTVADSPFGVNDPETKAKHQNDDINSVLSKDIAIILHGFTERLITALFATDKFIVVERRDIHKILREQDFAKGDRMSRTGALAQGELLSSQYLVTGAITFDRGEGADTTSDSEVEIALPIPGSRFRTTVGSGQTVPSDVGATGEGQAGAPTMGDRSMLTDARFECRRRPGTPFKYAFHLRVYDVSTSQIVSAVRVSADTQWCLIKAAVQRMTTQMDKSPWKTRVTAVNGDRVQIDGGRDVNMDFGYRLTHQPSGQPAPHRSRPAASADLQLLEINDVSSVARPVAASSGPDIRVGDWVVFNLQGAPR
jgi:curli biogenesis system outer membrane secretion channel CsgG